MDSSETNSGQDSSASVLAAQPPMPICRLCQKPRVLRDSHFIPAAFYYHLNLDENGVFQNKALQKLTRSRFARVPGQVKKHLLCHDCEQRFSAHGESWIAKMAHQVGHGFRLQEALLQLNPAMTLETGRVCHAEDDPQLDWEKLAYFALSVFWRGAADSWNRQDDASTEPFITLDANLQENLRRFLLGEADYPDDILLVVKVSASNTTSANMMSFPSNGTIETPEGPRPQTSFILPGMIFTLIPRRALPPEAVEQGCLIRGTGHPIFMMDSDELFFRETLKLALMAKPTQKIIEEAQALWREAFEDTD